MNVARVPRVLPGCILLLGAFVGWFSRGYLWQVLGYAAFLGGAFLLVGALRPYLDRPSPRRGWSWGRVLRESAGPVLLGILLLALYGQLLAGNMPWQGDHTVHQFKGWLLAEKLIPSGRVMGWTHQSGTGYPAEVLYPPLGDLWLALVRYATFKQLSWGATYAVGFFGVIATGVFAMYYAGRRFFGPLAGTAAALFLLTDVGGFREGGYVFTIQYGVWPLHLGIVLSLIGLVKVHDLLDTPGWRHFTRAALALAAALLAHPVALLFLGLAIPLYVVLAWARRPADAPPLLGRAVAVAALAVALAGFWLIPFLAKGSDFAAHVANQWKTMGAIADDLWGGTLWESAWVWPLVLGLTGGLVAWRERRPLGTYLLALSALLLLAASLTTYTALGLPNWFPQSRYIQFQRFVIFVKLLWFLLAGFLLQRLFVGLARGAADAAPREPAAPVTTPADGRPRTAAAAPAMPARLLVPPGRRIVAVGLACALAAPFVMPLAWQLVDRRVAPVGRLTTPRDRQGFIRDFRQVLAHVCAAKRRAPRQFFRLAYLSGFNDHLMANGSVFCDVPEVKLSFIPSETFKYRAHLSPAAVPRSAEDLRALNVRFAISRDARRPPPGFRQVLQRGGVRLFERPGYGDPPFTVIKRTSAPGAPLRYEPVDAGALGVTLERFADEEIRVRVERAPPDHFLVLHVAHFVNWEATRGDDALIIRPYDGLAPRVRGLMMVPLRAGVTVFEYGKRGSDRLGWVATLLGLILVVLLAVARRRPRLAARLDGRFGALARALRRPARWALVAVAVLGAGWLGLRAGGFVGSAPRVRSLTHELGSAQVSVRTRRGGRIRCGVFQFGRWICGPGRRYVGPIAEEWNLKNRFGLWAHPDERGTLVIDFPGERLGRHLEIDYGILNSGGAGQPVRLDVFVAGEHRRTIEWPTRRGQGGWAPRPLRIDTTARRGKVAAVRFEVSASDISGRHFAFDARIVR